MPLEIMFGSVAFITVTVMAAATAGHHQDEKKARQVA